MKFYVNKRLLKFKLHSLDYSKLLSNKKYFTQNKNKLLLNYYYNISNNIKNTIIFAKRLSGPKWFKILQDLGIKEIEQLSKKDLKLYISDNYCKECNKKIVSTKSFCSVKCTNVYKSKDPDFLKKLSVSVKESHKHDDKSRYKKISKSIKTTNNELSKEERSVKYSNNILRYTSFDNLSERFPQLNLLFDKDFYYSNRYLPVQCTECGFKWEMTKSTTMSRFVCVKCNPYKKHKTQSQIFDYIYSISNNTKENDKKFINPLELDILNDDFKFAIEYNGLLSHSFGKSKISYYNNYDIDSKYHLYKTEQVEENGYQLFHIFENEWLNLKKRNIWYSIINNKMNKNSKIYARKCVIKEVNAKKAKEFCELNHLQGNAISSVKLGLYYENELVSLMTFRKHKKYQWEIARFCSKLNTVITGGASKLLKYFERTYKPSSLLSYANRRWSIGNLYEKLGFEFSHNTKPNFFYFKENENILFARQKFQKHKINFNVLDEYRVIYDAGNKAYIKSYK